MTKLTIDTLPFAVGDIVTAYQKGFHRVVSIEKRTHLANDPSLPRHGAAVGDEYNPLVRYQQVARADGTLVTGKRIHECDAIYVQRVTPERIAAMTQALTAQIARLTALTNLR